MSEKKRLLRIAVMGTRGIPASYGGFETFAENLAVRLVERGHQVTVYCRRFFGEPYVGQSEYKGVRLKTLPTLRHKYFETVIHGVMSLMDLFRTKYDVVLLCNAANSPFAWLAKLRRVPVVINVDGIERRRTKWNRLARWWYRLGEVCSVLFAARVIADAKVIADYYQKAYRCLARIIPYGAEAVPRKPGTVLKSFGLTPGCYLLYVSRLEPENNALGVIEAYNGLLTKMPLVIVGDAPYAGKYIAALKERANSNVVFTGFQFGEAYQELRTNCYLYIQATQVGGTHPALVEGMAYGNCVLANATPENIEVLGEAGLYYRYNDFGHLRQLIQELLGDAERVKEMGEKARARAEKYYRWDQVTDQYEKLFAEVVQAA